MFGISSSRSSSSHGGRGSCSCNSIAATTVATTTTAKGWDWFTELDALDWQLGGWGGFLDRL
jgi:hypothetical protein